MTECVTHLCSPHQGEVSAVCSLLNPAHTKITSLIKLLLWYVYTQQTMQDFLLPESCEPQPARGQWVGTAGSPQGRAPAAAAPPLPLHLQHSAKQSHSDIIRMEGLLVCSTQRDRDVHLSCDRVQCDRYGNQVCVRAGGTTPEGRFCFHFLLHCRG